MKILSENLKALTTTVVAKFNKGLTASTAVYKTCCNEVNSTGAIETYPLTILDTSMREFVGQRVIDQPGLMKLDVRNKTYEKTVGILRSDIEDDKYNVLMPVVEQMGQSNGNLPDQLFGEVLNADVNWMDGAAFFGSRKIGKATINNKKTLALDHTNFVTVYEAMCAQKGADNKTPLNVVPNVLMVGNALKLTATKICEIKTRVVNGATVDNECAALGVQVVVNPYISGNKWFLMDCKNVIKPFIFQNRSNDGIVKKTDTSDEHIFMFDEILYGTRRRGAVAPFVPQLVFGSFPAS